MTTLLGLVVDLLTKSWAQTALAEQSITLLPNDFLRFDLHFNSGIAFSIPVPQLLQVVLTVALCLGIVWYIYWQLQSRWQQWGLSLTLGGALGNLYERTLFGEVTDFIAIWQFPIFNVADMLIVCGIGVFLLAELLPSRPST